MADIIRITIKGESGYGPVDEAYSDKVTIDRDSIRYEYKPVVESEINPPRKWSYKTTSPIYQKRFREATAAVEAMMMKEHMKMYFGDWIPFNVSIRFNYS